MSPLFDPLLRKIKLMTVIAVSLAATAGPLRAAWPPDGILVCGEWQAQQSVEIIYDEAGGCIVAWEDMRVIPRKIFAQRLDGAGNEYWTSGGVQVSGTGDQRMIEMVSDDAGGAILVWLESGSTIVAQRIDPDGTKLWDSRGINVADGDMGEILAVADGSGGCIMAWVQNVSGSRIYAQKIDRDGTIVWDDTPDNVVVSDASPDEGYPSLACDGFGGALVAFQSLRFGSLDLDIYVQRVFASGEVWIADGVPVALGHYNREEPVVAPDGFGGAFVCWEFEWGGEHDIYMNKVDAAGSAEWGTEKMVCVEDGDQYDLAMIEDGSGGVYVAWCDEREYGQDIYAQRLDRFGNGLWTTNGIQVIAEDENEFPMLLPCEEGVIAVWADHRGGGALFAQKVDISGGVMWDSYGVEVLQGDPRNLDFDVASDGACGILATITDDREGQVQDVYAQYLDALGDTSAPEPVIVSAEDVPGDQGGCLRINFAASDRDDNNQPLQLSRYDIWQRIEGLAATSSPAVLLMTGSDGRTILRAPAGGVVPEGSWELIASLDATQSETYACRVSTLADSSTSGIPWSVYMVTGHTTDPAVWYASAADSGYSVDNLAPEPPMGLAAEQDYNPEGLQLTWEKNTENDLAWYAIHRGTSEGFIPGTSTLVATPAVSEWFDEAWSWDQDYWYKVCAVDIHGNESSFAVSGPGDMTGEDLPDLPHLSYLNQNYPNPFNPSTTILFGLRQDSRVSLKVYDISGKLVSVVLDENRSAGHYTEHWNGLNSRGVPVASGVYFYRLISMELDQTRRMVLIR
ncbi:MAG: T9SS type A sorting domain-containing protein [Candidatus Krumholzibacteriota bacterium]|nr:T9SS type A sorting domain-containing protein [Candidatus Krumholzibacteriota bacterium]